MLTARRIQRGLTLVELLVSMTLGILIVLATVALYSVSSSTSATSTEEQGIQDSGRFALMLIGTAARQAGFINFDVNTPVAAPAYWPVEGTENAKVPSGTYTIASIGTNSNRSASDKGGDTVAFRFQPPRAADGSMPDCQGRNPVIAAASDVAMSSFFVDTDVDGEPALRCVAGTTSGTPSAYQVQSLVRGVESMQVMYGVDTDNDSIPNRWVDAATLAGIAAVAPATSPWGMVTAIRVGLVIRGAPGSAQDTGTTTLYPLGQNFASTASFTTPADGRLRKVFTATFQLRNPQNWGI